MRLGCDTSMKRKYIKSHESKEDQHHLHLALNKLISLEDVTCERMEVERSGGFTFKLSDFSKRKDEFVSPSFYTSPSGYHMNIEVYAGGCGIAKGTHISVFVCVVEGKYDAELNWPFVGDITVTVLNQLENKNHYSNEICMFDEDNSVVGSIWGFDEFIPLSTLDNDPIKKTHYLKDDTLYFRVKVDVKDRKPWLECTSSY